ncbi:SH3 domain-containing protein [Anaerobacillus isosaccharinicus]|uniref:SH3 domain-containing protein n=1 Tax=Anaerobacillus isosaccharinicus TaxID=1532552 RepID=A0A1S2L322_9BACI|nr:SH3 domain-containing protein [Anaerobacillus isosaccharinicus]MBA5585195.1 SH3 domain-containing protein [Anaerobacillus isosaccharinicus]QOY36467.1 SH3 domain-containing protein [Anaerobacillus isosaccharinicus]
MSKKALLNIFLLLLFTISLVGCSKQVTLPAEVSNPEDQKVVMDNENGVEEQDEIKEEEQGEIKEEKAEEISEDTENGTDNKESDKENQENVLYISASKLNVRADSNTKSKVLGSLAKGQEVKVIEEVKTEETIWYKIELENTENNNEGWILSQYTVQDMNDLLTSPTLFDDKDMNDYFTSPTLFDDNTIIAYYGHPNSKIMGIVGRHSKEELISLVQETSEKYDALNGDQGVIPAVYLVYGTVQPEGEISKMNFDLVMSYIEAAYKNGILIYLDHQMGKYYPTNALNEILPFLKYPNVHLALDPEWRTNKPMKEVGHLTGTELNEIQETMRDYIISNGIQGKRQFVFQQFIETMIHDIEAVSSNYDPVLLVHNTSGWGPPEGKVATHTKNAKATNIPYKGFKLWYFYSNKPGVHFDNPLMTPEQVLELNPKPGLIIYQ